MRDYRAGAVGLLSFSGTATQQALGTGRSNYYPSDFAGNLLKESFDETRPIQLEPHEQVTGMSANQMVQVTRAVGLQFS